MGYVDDYRRVVALLRGVNVGGVRMKMANLRRAVEDLGYWEVRTVLASGNVLLTSVEDIPTITERLQDGLAEALGYTSRIIVLEQAELARIVARSPYDGSDPDRHAYVVFAAEPGPLDEVLALRDELDPAVERVAPGPGVVYWEVARGHTLNSRVGTLLGTARRRAETTTRNMRTLVRMVG